MMRSRGSLAIAALGGACLVGLGYLAASARTEAPAATPGARPADGTDPTELADIRRELARLRVEVGQRPVEVTRVAAAPERDPRTDPELRAELAQKRAEYMAGVDAAFRKEATDTTWSTAASATVRTALAADPELQALARDVECRGRTCRIELADDGGRLGKALPLFAQAVGHDLPSMTADRGQDANGAATTILYFARADASL